MAKRKPSKSIVKSVGKPPKEIDPEKVELLAASFLPVDKIARILEVAESVLYERYADYLQRGRENRRLQLAMALWEKGLIDKDTKMLIWLSKQHLGYRDTMPDGAQVVNINVQVNEIPT